MHHLKKTKFFLRIATQTQRQCRLQWEYFNISLGRSLAFSSTQSIFILLGILYYRRRRKYLVIGTFEASSCGDWCAGMRGRERERLHLGAGYWGWTEREMEDVGSSASQSQSRLAELSDTDWDREWDSQTIFIHRKHRVLRILQQPQSSWPWWYQCCVPQWWRVLTAQCSQVAPWMLDVGSTKGLCSPAQWCDVMDQTSKQ